MLKLNGGEVEQGEQGVGANGRRSFSGDLCHVTKTNLHSQPRRKIRPDAGAFFE